MSWLATDEAATRAANRAAVVRILLCLTGGMRSKAGQMWEARGVKSGEGCEVRSRHAGVSGLGGLGGRR